MASLISPTSCIFDLNDGKRELVDGERAKVIVERALEGKSIEKITRIRLSNKSYDEEAATVIAEALSRMESVTEADLSDMIAGRHEDMALRVLSIICDSLKGKQLKLIDVSDNAMGEKGINACRSILEGQENLASLKMCNDGLSASAMECMKDILLKTLDINNSAIPTPTRLTTLHFFNNMSGDGGAKALAAILPLCPLLTDLRFSGTRAGREGSEAVAKSLASLNTGEKCVNFVSLDLADNSFGSQGGKNLAKLLANQPNLTYLSLRDGSLEDRGARAVLKSLSSSGCPNLVHLDMAANDMTKRCDPGVSDALKVLPHLEFLSFEENDSFGNVGAKAVASALSELSNLRVLQLSICGISTPGAVAVVRAVVEAKHIEKLEMNGNAISEEGLEEINDLLSTAEKEDILGDMDDNDPDEEPDENDESDAEDSEVSESESENVEEGESPDNDLDDLTAQLSGVKV